MASLLFDFGALSNPSLMFPTSAAGLVGIYFLFAGRKELWKSGKADTWKVSFVSGQSTRHMSNLWAMGLESRKHDD